MTVIWEESVLDELADIWLRADAPERRRITSAAAEIERRLIGDPKNEGESRSANRRILHAPPLGVIFRVKEPSQIVQVLRVWHVRRRTK